MAINKVVLNDVVKLDLTADTVTPETLAEGVTAHDAAGNPVTGTMVVKTPTLTVSTNAGAAVTATKGSLSVSGTADSSGLCVLELPEFGEWTVTASLSGLTETNTINIASEQSISVFVFNTLTISGDLSSKSYVTVNGTTYSAETTLTLQKNTEISVYVGYNGWGAQGSSIVTYNGNTVKTGEGTYTFSIEDETNIVFTKVTQDKKYYYNAEITTASYDTSAAVASILLGEDI